MSTDFRPIDYSVSDVGKIMKSSKKRHMWSFVFKSKRFTLCVFESLKSGKFRIELNKKCIYETIGGKRSISKKVHDARLGTMTIELMKITNNQYRLTINNNTFESKSSQQKLFVYETFEQKQKNLQKQSKANEGEDYFGLNKGTSKGLKGSDLFGKFKGKNQKSEKLKLKFGAKKKDGLFKFDNNVFGKKGNFGENDFFGAKNTKTKTKKSDPFAEGSDLFASKKNKKVTTDFDGFDIFGDSKKKGNVGSISKNKASAFDDFGFGAKKTNAKNNQKSNWDDIDFFGNKKKKTNEDKSGGQGRSAQNEIFGGPAKKSQDEDLLDFDIGVPSKPEKKDFGDLNWDMPVKPKKPLKKVSLTWKIF